jgi:UDP-N-acetylmuramate dehydrogenase
METTIESLVKFGCEIEKQAKLSSYTTFRLGGPCQYLIKCALPHQLEKTVAVLQNRKLNFYVIGEGANLLVSDDGIDCVIIRYLSTEALIQSDENDLTVSGATLLDHLVSYAAEQGLFGLNDLSGIPGTVGGAIVGNAGAFGKQIGDVIKSVVVINRHGEKRIISADELGFKYRNSRFKETGEVVVSVIFTLHQGNHKELLLERNQILATRKDKHPYYLAQPTAGSFFRNVSPTSSAQKQQAAGWYLEQVNAKDFSCGGAYVYEKHANIIVCRETCRAQDVYDLAQMMSEAVKTRFGIELTREVRYLGRFKGMPEGITSIIW